MSGSVDTDVQTRKPDAVEVDVALEPRLCVAGVTVRTARVEEVNMVGDATQCGIRDRDTQRGSADQGHATRSSAAKEVGIERRDVSDLPDERSGQDVTQSDGVVHLRAGLTDGEQRAAGVSIRNSDLAVDLEQGVERLGRLGHEPNQSRHMRHMAVGQQRAISLVMKSTTELQSPDDVGIGSGIEAD